ncbi:TetR/AcrR family transcriptional regulator [Paludibacterium yongneupense]|uniref:TetR/AcrR family transcriptional regulator n=1 Tax=Paludibacterium yongneupense TaxID=400061 RepID=UPI0004165934|nr:TetR/AcrR family transcriptional regulator [Paludibacterium yongneupense]
MAPDTDPRGDTRKRILDIAETLLLTRGFNGFSYQAISGELGVKNAAIHYHFPHKTDLGIELIQRYRRRFRRFTEAQADLDAASRLDAYFELTDSYYRRHRQVCPSGILSTEFHTLPCAMQDEAALFIEEMRAWSVAIARQGRDGGVFHYAGSAEAMGAVMFSALQGGLQLARVDAELLGTLKYQLKTLLGIAPALPERGQQALSLPVEG